MDQLKNHFENDFIWDAGRYLNNEQELIRFKETLGLFPTEIKKLIDVGTGNGAFLKYIESNNPGIEMEGVEYTDSGIRNKLCESNILQGTITDLPYKSDSQELITCLEVIEHLSIDVYQKAIIELERVSNKYILISVPHSESRINVICPYCKCEFNPNTHVRSFDKDKMSSLFKNFVLVDIKEVGLDKEFFIKSLRNEFRRIFARKNYPYNLTCIQCGFSKGNAKLTSNKDKGEASSFKKKLFEKLFFYNKPKWFVALYALKS